jgi:hypothetical protein
VINDQTLLKRELDLVDALGDMEVASKLISKSKVNEDEEGNPLNPLDVNFRSLGLTGMHPVQQKSKEWNALDKYVQDTHGATHRHYSVSVLNAYRVERFVVSLDSRMVIYDIVSEEASQRPSSLRVMVTFRVGRGCSSGTVLGQRTLPVSSSRVCVLHPQKHLLLGTCLERVYTLQT